MKQSLGLEPRRLELEINETILIQDSDAVGTLHRLRALGLRIVMDDFGTRCSSLSYLRRFPFDKIKIDQSFVRDLADDSEAMAIVRAITGLGSSLGIVTTAEGVATNEQLALLRQEGCTEVQGFLFGVAKPATEVDKMLARPVCASSRKLRAFSLTGASGTQPLIGYFAVSVLI